MQFFLLQNEINEFMNSKNLKMPELKCYQWLCYLSFLSDIMSHLNQGCGRGSGPFSVEAEARKTCRFRFHIGYLT